MKVGEKLAIYQLDASSFKDLVTICFVANLDW
jgi:hypothetical protein